MIRFEDRRARPVAALDPVCESVLDTRIDVEIGESTRRELVLDFREERPDQTVPAAARIDEDVEEASASAGPGRPGDGETDQRLTVPERSDNSARIRQLTADLARRERARTPLVPFELQHPLTDASPGRIAWSEDLDDRGHG
jgi:hypothetical protein